MAETENISDGNRFEIFVSWLHANSCSTNSLEIVDLPDNEGGRGIISKKTFVANERLLAVPDRLIITTDTVWKSDLKNAIAENSGLLQPFDALCLFMICERLKGSDSSWSPYMAVLPSGYSNPVVAFPRFSSSLFPPKVEQNFLKQAAEVLSVRERVRTVFRVWAKNVRNEAYEFDESLFLWAWATVNTRCIYKLNMENDVFNNAQGDTLALVPFLDMFNHSPVAKIAAKYNKKTNCYEFVLSDHVIVADEQVFISYGPHDNEKLFLEYGFVVNENPNNVVQFDFDDLHEILAAFEIRPNECITQKHWDALVNSQLNCYIYYAQLEPSWSFTAVFRLLSMEAKDLLKDKWRTIFDDSNLYTDPATLKVAMYFLRTYFQRLKDKRPSKADFVNTTDDFRKCVTQLWEDEIFIITQCIQQLEGLMIEC